MQGNCPQCGNSIVIADAKVPDRPFSVKCPKCQNVVRFPGRPPAAAAPEPIPPMPEPAAPAHASATESLPGSEEMRAQMMAQIRRELTTEGKGVGGRALVALPDRGQAGAITLTLTRQGFQVDTCDDMEEGARLLEQGAYQVAVTARVAGSAGKESLYQRISRLSPDARRRVFLILVGDEFKTGDGTQSFVCLADLVVSGRDAGSADVMLRGTLAERQRLYQVYLDARSRHESMA